MIDTSCDVGAVSTHIRKSQNRRDAGSKNSRREPRNQVAARVLDEIRQHTDAIIGRFVTLKPAGPSLKGLCPFHEEKTPSFSVHREKHIFRCFGCGESGDVFRFVELIEDVAFPQAIRIAAEIAGVRLRDEEPRAIAKRIQEHNTERALARWREEKLHDFGQLLRDRDELARMAHDTFNAGLIDEELAWEAFSVAYANYGELEDRWEKLFRSDRNPDTLALWRDARQEAA